MAKVVVLSEFLNSSCLQFIESLRQQKHEVTLVTFADTVIPENLKGPVWQALQKKSMAKSLPLILRFFQEDFDVLHFFFANQNCRLHASYLMLSYIFGSQRSRVVAATFMESPKSWVSFHEKAFLRTLHFITAANRIDLFWLKQQDLNPRCRLEMIPPLISQNQTSPKSSSSEWQEFAKSVQPYVLVSSPEASDVLEHSSVIQDAQFNWLSFGNRPKPWAGSKLFYIGSPTGTELQTMVEHSNAIFLAFSDHSAEELYQYLQLSLQFEIPVIINSNQAELVPGAVRHGKNAWILAQGSTSLRNLLYKNPTLRLNYEPTGLAQKEVMDQYMNLVSRAYSQLIHLRSRLSGSANS